MFASAFASDAPAQVAATQPSSEVVDRTSAVSTFGWTKLPDVPDAVGIAAPYAGASGGALIVAGGANFPGGPPWAGGTKVWQDAVYVLPSGAGAWQRDALRLVGPRGYGVSLTTPDGILCFGGSDESRHYADAFRLRYVGGLVERDALPPLPVALANLSAAIVGDAVYVIGGIETPVSTAASSRLFTLKLAAIDKGWAELEPLPGPGRMLAVAASQGGAFYVASGVALAASADGKPVREYLRDAYRFTPGKGWSRIADLPHAVAAAPSPAASVGPSHFLIFGGDDGNNVGRTVDHPGFLKTSLAYHALTDTWVQMGDAPGGAVTTTVVPYAGGFVVPSGEVSPGVRSPAVHVATPVRRKAAFGWLNYATFAGYLALMMAVGLYCTSKEKNTEQFFRGGQRVPWWAAGLSIYATMLSSISYMAIPAKAYASDWGFYFNAVAIVLVSPIVIYAYLPFYRQLDVTSAYEYLERRFNVAIRLFGSASFILLQLGRLAIVLYLPSLALATVSSLDLVWCIVIIGALSVVYSVTGGIDAVIWTDVLQSIVLLLSAGVALWAMIAGLNGGLGEFVSVATANDKFFQRVNWGWDTASATVAVIVVGSMFSNLVSYTAGQDVVQRYVTTKDEKRAAWGIWTNAALSLPSSALFFLLGTALFVFYKSHPGRLDPMLPQDAIFPQFMVREMPAGVGGLVVAGLFAAAQPGSSFNSIASAWVTDFHKRFRPATTDATLFRIAQVVTVLAGVVGIGIACLMAKSDIKSLWDLFLQVLGLSGGALAGLFALGMFTTRANGTGAIAGVLASVAAVVYVWQRTSVNFFLYAMIGILVCFGVGYVVSLIVPSRSKSLDGLTIFTRRPAAASDEPSPAGDPVPA